MSICTQTRLGNQNCVRSEEGASAGLRASEILRSAPPRPLAGKDELAPSDNLQCSCCERVDRGIDLLCPARWDIWSPSPRCWRWRARRGCVVDDAFVTKEEAVWLERAATD